MLHFDCKRIMPEHWKDAKSISAAEFIAWQKGELKTREKKGPKLRLNQKRDYATLEKGELTIVIHELPPSQNQWKQWHWSVVAKEKERWEQIIWAVLFPLGYPLFQKPVVQVKFCFPDNRRRDPSDNYMSWKPLTDGLTKAGVIKDDAWQYTRVLEPVVVIDRFNPRIEIGVREGYLYEKNSGK